MTTFYDEVGGTEFFEELVSAFYAVVAIDPILSPMYPDKDWHAAAERLQMFLEQYWGGPHTYSEVRGHPRLRMRHAPFYISKVEHDAWLQCMHAAIIHLDMAEEMKEELWTYFQYAANSMINQPN